MKRSRAGVYGALAVVIAVAVGSAIAIATTGAQSHPPPAPPRPGTYVLGQPQGPAAVAVATARELKKFRNHRSPEFATTPAWLQDFSAMPDGDLLGWHVDLGTGVDGWYNKEVASYTGSPANLRIEGGKLVIEANKEPQDAGEVYTSARVSTVGIKSFQYGRIDVVAKLPGGTGTWPAIWLIAQNDKYLNETPKKDPQRYLNDGELDIVETVFPGIVYSIAQARLSVSGLPNEHDIRYPLPNDTRAFHEYSLEWTPTRLTFLLDNKAVYTLNKAPSWNWQEWPYDQPYYLVMNLALGGVWGGHDAAQYPPSGINNKDLPQSMEIRSVAYYPYLGRT